MNAIFRRTLMVAGLAVATHAAAQVTIYEGEGFEGRSFTTETRVSDLERHGFNDRASSVVVRGERWEVCENARFSGRCVVLRAGRYPSLAALGLNDRISSVRDVGRDERIEDRRFAPAPDGVYRAGRRHDEPLFEANITSVHAVIGPPQQRCWIEHEAVAGERGGANVPGAIAGAVIGGILGHQVGGGRGNDVATVGGAVAGAAVGANVGRDGGGRTQDVQRCAETPSQASPDYWDVTYDFRGREHRMQMTAPPGRTVIVNEWGEPKA
ncbi:MAG: beta/gamma crystallin-related protein [Rhodocyclaceae bacterium]|nr:beta/gamma crystallin-related protein [Rhodocyclaceae bacterium]